MLMWIFLITAVLLLSFGTAAVAFFVYQLWRRSQGE